MPEVLPQNILARISPKMIDRFQCPVVLGPGRGRAAPVPYTFARADASTCATSIDRDGLVRLAPANKLRIEWVDLDGDGIRETPGFLLEGSRTNLCLRSEEFDNATWLGASAAVTANSDIAPDGTLTADTLTDDDAGAFESKAQVWTVANDSLPHVFGIFVKKTTAATNTFGLNIALTGGTSVSQFPRLNTNSGVVSAGSDARTISVGDYWLLVCKITNNTTGNTGLTITVFPATGTNSGSNPGTDSVTATGSAVVWGAQLEKAAFLSSYIKTTSAAVTRAADSLSVPINFGPVDGTVFARVARPMWADATGDIGLAPGVFALGGEVGSVPHVRGGAIAATRHWFAFIDTAGTDAQSANQSVVAGASLSMVWQFKNLTTGGQISLDGGSGPSAFSAAATAFPAFVSQTLRVGRIASGSEFFGVILDLFKTRGLFTAAEATAVS